MTKKRANYLYKFTGTIHKKYRRTNPDYEQHFYQLKVKLKGYSCPPKFSVFKNKTKSTL